MIGVSGDASRGKKIWNRSRQVLPVVYGSVSKAPSVWNNLYDLCFYSLNHPRNLLNPVTIETIETIMERPMYTFNWHATSKGYLRMKPIDILYS